mmetsp:Transcript_55486/g.81579  ORF Transcript_55486/g.81579 Transcript_55486/m.81579 type:complete len:118 (+) Transcript_55486:47-400(+)
MDVKQCVIHIYDSLATGFVLTKHSAYHVEVHHLLREWLAGVYTTYYNLELPTSWDAPVSSPTISVPQQNNGRDCGVFVLLCASWYVVDYMFPFFWVCQRGLVLKMARRFIHIFTNEA